jgi:hypothetical protein
VFEAEADFASDCTWLERGELMPRLQGQRNILIRLFYHRRETSARLEEDISELMIDDILRPTTNLYNQVAATIFSPRSTDDGHNESSAGREACR